MPIKKRYIKNLVSLFIMSLSMCCWAQELVVVKDDVAIKIKNVPLICQYPELPTGCEATALAMLVQAFGLDRTKCEVANEMIKVGLPTYTNGKNRGAHPDEGFIGNPYTTSSYGVFAKPILLQLEKYFPGRGEDLCGQSLDDILKVVAEGRPVMIWVTIGMSNVSYTQSWYTSSGELFKWPNNEHAMVIIGYDKDFIYFNDPYTGKEKNIKEKLLIIVL